MLEGASCGNRDGSKNIDETSAEINSINDISEKLEDMYARAASKNPEKIFVDLSGGTYLCTATAVKLCEKHKELVPIYYDPEKKEIISLRDGAAPDTYFNGKIE